MIHASRLLIAVFLTCSFLCMPVMAVELYPFHYGAGTYYVNASGVQVLDVQGLVLGTRFYEGLAAVQSQSSGLWGFIDSTGTLVIAPQFTTIVGGRFSWGRAAVQRDGSTTYGYIDHSGSFVVPDTFAFLGAYDDRQMAVYQPRNSQRYGYLNFSGEIVTYPMYSNAWDFRGDYARVSSNLRAGVTITNSVIDRTGNVVFMVDDVPLGIPSDGLIAVGNPTTESTVWSATFYRLGDTTYTPVLSNVLCREADFRHMTVEEGRCPFPAMVNGQLRWGILSVAGDTIVPPKYVYPANYEGDRAWGMIENQSGNKQYECIDLYGNIVFSTINGNPITAIGMEEYFGRYLAFVDGVCAVTTQVPGSFNVEKAWVDRNGRVVVSMLLGPK